MDPMHPLGNCGCPSDLSFFPGKCIQPDSQWRDIKPHNGHVCPEAAAGGPIGLVEEGDIICIDIDANTINMKVSEEELARRRENWTPKTKPASGYLRRYRNLVTSADKGAILKED